jgi:hypothetical protein
MYTTGTKGLKLKQCRGTIQHSAGGNAVGKNNAGGNGEHHHSY